MTGPSRRPTPHGHRGVNDVTKAAAATVLLLLAVLPPLAPAPSAAAPFSIPLEWPLRAASADAPGAFSMAGDLVSGRYVSFRVNGSTGLLADLEVEGARYLSGMQAPGPLSARVDGEEIRLVGAGFDVTVTDHPSGLVRLSSPGLPFLLTPTREARMEERSDHVRLVHAQGLAIVGPAEREGFSVRVTEGAFWRLGPAGSLLPPGTIDADGEEAIAEAIVAGRVVARIEAGPEGVTLLRYRSDPLAVESLGDSRWRWVLPAREGGGRVVVIEADPSLVDEAKAEVRFYEEVLGLLVPTDLPKARDLEDALRPDAGEGAEAHRADRGGAVRVIAAVPGSGGHALELRGTAPPLAPQVVYGVLLGVLLVVAVSVLLVSGRRREA